MKTWFNKCMAVMLAILLLVPSLAPSVALADAVTGEVIVTLGQDLSQEQRQQILNEMGVDDTVEIIYVTNAEEHQYLGDYISASQIGTRALSSSKITLTEPGTGLHVESNNIDRIADTMYANALVTAGVEDADIYVTAPFPVSGTAALTGLLKAYEVAADVTIPEEQKQVANEEMVKTSELAERVGVEEATELMNRIKEEIAANPVETEDELRDLIRRLAEELGITLTDEELNGLVSLFMRMKDLNIDWNKVQDGIQHVRDNLDDFLNREETQSIIRRILDMISELIDALIGLFTSSE
ncbi:DUF1002 domain-containing protein [Halalkalibacterium halodurans]|uniref:BH1404 protein n=2 Tax=Halalkalibacterium halodurans TaxID=86665 RepID=Q9KD15_HALH5|nr:DUF1002 domain-containing protein [Halalkalibacterium halodurans]MDY7221928.1 DUF1002 domain-containing protein [Halalkalibacterium halodurans]MDY7241204.1 DUF1002 domain-containing protein [Halalkalibacterium halodurans]MED4081766.1 DUF1002 domain-containing protein [Halalkalibacterium halodurans]MED4087064.1 DUF1002 domain-containing protein [Halalkalibacterium halodurans]MED4103883.1 DUF1002 domain-containing protein [Halalkalibacterium halodurans]